MKVNILKIEIREITEYIGHFRLTRMLLLSNTNSDRENEDV